jgi:hypothetical protein
MCVLTKIVLFEDRNRTDLSLRIDSVVCSPALLVMQRIVHERDNGVLAQRDLCIRLRVRRQRDTHLGLVNESLDDPLAQYSELASVLDELLSNLLCVSEK